MKAANGGIPIGTTTKTLRTWPGVGKYKSRPEETVLFIEDRNEKIKPAFILFTKLLNCQKVNSLPIATLRGCVIYLLDFEAPF